MNWICVYRFDTTEHAHVLSHLCFHLPMSNRLMMRVIRTCWYHTICVIATKVNPIIKISKLILFLSHTFSQMSDNADNEIIEAKNVETYVDRLFAFRAYIWTDNRPTKTSELEEKLKFIWQKYWFEFDPYLYTYVGKYSRSIFYLISTLNVVVFK